MKKLIFILSLVACFSCDKTVKYCEVSYITKHRSGAKYHLRCYHPEVQGSQFIEITSKDTLLIGDTLVFVKK